VAVPVVEIIPIEGDRLGEGDEDQVGVAPRFDATFAG
jgi:hypothetical protein